MPPGDSSDETEVGQDVSGAPAIACGDAAEVLEPAERILDGMSLFIGFLRRGASRSVERKILDNSEETSSSTGNSITVASDAFITKKNGRHKFIRRIAGIELYRNIVLMESTVRDLRNVQPDSLKRLEPSGLLASL
jgi:hypothetical protein